MRARILLLAGLAVACGHTATLDRSKVAGTTGSDVAVRDVPVRGAETRVYLKDGGTLDGELLAVGAHGIALHVDREDVIVSETAIEKIRVTAYSNALLTGALVTWTALGVGSSVSHGLFFIFSAPIWALTGAGTSIASGVDPDQSAVVLSGEQAQLWQFARFPQGLPPGFPIAGQKATPAPAPAPLPAPDVAPLPAPAPAPLPDPDAAAEPSP